MSQIDPTNWKTVVPPTLVTATGGCPLIVSWTLLSTRNRRILIGVSAGNVAITGTGSPSWAIAIPAAHLPTGLTILNAANAAVVTLQAYIGVSGTGNVACPVDVVVLPTSITFYNRAPNSVTLAADNIITGTGLQASWAGQPLNITAQIGAAFQTGYWQLEWSMIDA